MAERKARSRKAKERRNSKNEVVNWTKLFNQYAGQWVVLRDDERSVIASGKNIEKVWENAKQKDSKGILLKVPTDVVTYFGGMNEIPV